MAKAARQKPQEQSQEQVQEKAPVISDKLHYQEWRVELKDGKADKLKIVRPVVKITEDQAAILNDGMLKGNNNIGNMYFLPE
jgi:hypothetical protein